MTEWTFQISHPENLIGPPTIEIPSLVASGLRAGLDRLSARVEAEKPEALVIFLRSAGVLSPAVQKRLPDIPLIEINLDSRFAAQYLNKRKSEIPGFFDDDEPDMEIAGHRDDYLDWLKSSDGAKRLAGCLKQKMAGIGREKPGGLMGVDDVSYTGVTGDFTWPELARMAFGEKIKTPFVWIFHIDWLRQIVVHNFGARPVSPDEFFLERVIRGMTLDGREIKGKGELLEIEGLVKRICGTAEIYLAEKLLSSWGEEYLVSLHRKVAETLAQAV